MCGIWGFVTAEKGRGATARLKFATQAAYVGTMRGSDSAGVTFVPHGENVGTADWIKAVGTGQDLLNTEYAKERLTVTKFGNYRAVIGHNRSATYGDVSTHNAHPFQEGPITLVHNGTLNGTYGMPINMSSAPKKQKIRVDSHLICHNLSEHPWKEVLETLDGAYVLVWHDARDNKVYMARNAQRPLHLMRVKDEDTVLFASEADMLWWLAGRNNFSRTDMVSLDPGVLLSFSHGSTKPEHERYDLYKRKVYTGGHHGTASTGGAAAAGKATASAHGPDATGAMTTTSAGTTKTSRRLLKEAGVDPTVPLEFSPDSIIPYPSPPLCTVNGWAYKKEKNGETTAIQSIIHGLVATFARHHYNEIWTVRPIGVTVVGSEDEADQALICRLVKVSGNASRGSEPRGRGPLDLFQGPGDSWVDRKEWFKLTSNGCVRCGVVLNLSDAKDLSWTSGPNPEPVCSLCSKNWEEDVQLLRRMI